MSKPNTIFRRDVVGWSLYDFANTIYSMNILSLYFKRWVVEDLKYDGLYYDLSYSGSMLLAGLIMPALGAISDHTQKKKIFLFLFTFACCLSLGLIPIIPNSLIIAIVVVFGLSNFFYEGGLVFYNSLLYSVSDGKEARMVSGFGVALGYFGSIVGMILVLPFVTGEIYGLNISWLDGWGKAGSFIPSAILFFLFALPLFMSVRETGIPAGKKFGGIKKAYHDVWEGIKDTKKYPGVLRFLIADYFFEDSVATVILNIGIFSSLVIGLSDSNINTFLIISTVSAMLGSYLIGRLSTRMNLKKFMSVVIWGWIFALTLFAFSENRAVIYALGSLIGVLLGGLWTLSRPLLAEMVPRHELGRFFGLYSLSGRSAAVVGPVMWGLLVFLFNPARPAGEFLSTFLNLSVEASAKLPYRIGVLSLVLIMAVGLFIFRRVPSGGPGKDNGFD
ncbi:MAG TPA: MFS transporter [candidate division Zixibacteria bacterium]|nr:MFS transporter [candidate division Zixibacteria bacterium]